MATKVIEEQEPTIASRIVARADSRVRLAVLLAIVAAIIALAPWPYASVGAAALVLVAFDAGKRK